MNVPNSNFALSLISNNWFYRADTLTGNPTALNAYIQSVMNDDPCKDKTTPTGTLSPHSTLPYPILRKNSNIYGQVNKDTATWVLKDLNNNKNYYPCKSIKIGEEYYFSELGLSVSIGGTNDIANIGSPFNQATDRKIAAGDIIGASLGFSSNTGWLTGVPDVDGATAFNWIRSGTYTDNDIPANNDYELNNAASGSNLIFADENQYFENVLGGTWAPYALVAPSKNTAPNIIDAAPGYPNLVTAAAGSGGSHATLLPVFDLRTLASVDIVFTSDKSKWTRAIVLEECDEANAIPSKAGKLEPRRRRSVDKQGVALGDPGCVTAEAFVDSANGTPYYYGLSWFPGYAINLETGERLNIAFGEDSYQADNNGDDMMWNPNHVVTSQTYRYCFGGRHYIYVFGNNRGTTKYKKGSEAIAFVPSALNGKVIGSGNYSNFSDFVYTYKWGYASANTSTNTAAVKNSGNVVLTNIWSDAMWVNIPVTTDPRYNFKNPANMPGDAKVSLRVKKAYRPSMAGHSITDSSRYTQAGYITSSNALNLNFCPTIEPIFPYSSSSGPNFFLRSSVDTLTGSSNNNYNLYTFNTADIFTEINNSDKHKSALDLINVVPNPYYAYSAYEQERKDNRIRITNLPNKCKIRIYTLNGTLVRTFDRDLSGQEDIVVDESDFIRSKRLPYQDWDLKNQSGISVASGLYIIHVDVPGVGEKILKWFGVMRPLDLQSY